MVRKSILLICWLLASDIYKNSGKFTHNDLKKIILNLSSSFHIKNDLMCVGMEKKKCGKVTPIGLVLSGHNMFTKCFEMVGQAVLMTAYDTVIMSHVLP